MASPALVVRVAATIEELRANLKQGVSQIETTTAAMGKLAASFTGDKLIQAAHNVTAAVTQIGGASKLTDAEAARVNATLEKALEKYAALGREAPAGMRQLADETKRTDTASSGLTDTVKQLALGFAAMFTVRAAYNFVKDTLDEASALKDLSQQTHINVEELQLLAGGMSEFGVDADELGKALYKLSRGIAGGDESVATGLHLMGLSLKDVEGLQGKELFLKIEAGLATLQGGLRDTAAAELFGGKLGAAMAGASEGIEGTLATWQRLNHVASTESVDAMDAFGEAIARSNKNLSAIAANMIGPVAQGFNVLFDAVDKGASKWAIAWAMLKDDTLSGPLNLFGAHTENLTTLLNEQAGAAARAAAAITTGAAAHTEVTAAVDKRTAAEKFMAALEADAAVTLTTSQLAMLAHLKEIGALTGANAAALGVNAAAFKKYEADQTAASKAAEKAAEEAKKALDAYHDFQIKTHAIAMKALTDEAAERKRVLDLQNKHIVDAALQIKEIQDAQRDEQRRATLSETDYTILKANEAAAAKIRAFSGVGDQVTVYEELIRRELAKTVDQIRGDTVTLIGGAKEVGAANQQAAADTHAGYSIAFADAGGGFAAFKGAVLQGNQEMIASTFGVASAYAGLLSNIGTPKAVGGLRVATSADIAAVGSTGFRAAGGPVASGSPYVVGERGPELFVPDRAGTIVPSGGGVTVHAPITINGSVLSDESKLGAAVSQALMSTLLRLGVRLPARS
jgi:hypothetical protein